MANRQIDSRADSANAHLFQTVYYRDDDGYSSYSGRYGGYSDNSPPRGGELFEMCVLFGGGILFLWALSSLWEKKFPRDTEDRRTGRPWGYVGEWPPNGREPEERKPAKWAK